MCVCVCTEFANECQHLRCVEESDSTRQILLANLKDGMPCQTQEGGRGVCLGRMCAVSHLAFFLIIFKCSHNYLNSRLTLSKLVLFVQNIGVLDKAVSLWL